MDGFENIEQPDLIEIENLSQLIRAIAQANFGGYGDAMTVDISQEHSTGGDLIIKVDFFGGDQNGPIIENYVGTKLFGEFYFDADDDIAQVL